MEGVCVNLSAEGVILRNLKGAMYKMTVNPLESKVISMSSHGNYIFVGIANQGCHIYKLSGNKIEFLNKISSPIITANNDSDMNCHEMRSSPHHLVYIQEMDLETSVCVHLMEDILSGELTPVKTLPLARKAPLIMEPQLKFLVMGGIAWISSWTSANEDSTEQASDESHVRVLSLDDLECVADWKAVQNGVGLLRALQTDEHSLLGVSDTRAGLKVYDLREATEKGEFVLLYQVPVDEIRNFRLVGNFVAVFHKFEPNVSFWNMKEKRTILCINIQDQMKQLAEEFLEDEDDDAGLFGDDDDHVTAVTHVPSDEDYILIYGTKSGCVFGMSVLQRTKLFNIPCPHEAALEEPTQRKDVQAIAFVPPGKLAVCYEKYGFTTLDFSPENPPDRPPTRCQKRV
ncbi:hypothetical protein CAPTEDRAFT_220197 [Capitella teleta]|uniref:Uncharacterized protein n=1 Tax=Capitella teleta TaxID=283909 RepID=R7V9C3_CAPTE|nr:hypothetical protein CAPTEDRAFT_220197 [Capitella teleta]|eukprot:ELU12335.1 hypothetical protein CAPTEDRAFT_220197 [Capitella teleta]